ncbi:MAG: hypothetical protein V3U28_03030 [Candidatus Acidoferrales bacterium]
MRTKPFLPLLLPPVYCPQGGERMNANWNYCPWHGVELHAGETSAQ